MGIPETIGYYPEYQGLEKVSNHLHRWENREDVWKMIQQ